MANLKNKSITSAQLPSTPANVSAQIISQLPLVFEVTATVGSTSYTERHTIGADGTGPAMAQADLQDALDKFRQSAADKAAYQENMRQLTQGLQ